MAFANLGRNKRKTVLVVISLSLSVVLLNLLVTFTGGFDMEKYLAKQTCADFIVSSTDYFRYNRSESYISQEQMEQIKANTSASFSGCGYQLLGSKCWITEEAWRAERSRFGFSETLESELAMMPHRGELVGAEAQIEGLDESLFEKLTVVEGDLTPLFQEDSNAIAMAVYTDDYGKVSNLDQYPPIGSTQTVSYVEEGYYIDSRTGKKCEESTPQEFVQYYVAQSRDVNYTVCAYVTIPYSMSYRYGTLGHRFLLPVTTLVRDSQQKPVPLFWLFDTPDTAAEDAAECYLAELTANDLSPLMYESKTTLRAEFKSYQKMFLLLGGLLCAIIGLVGVLNFFNAMMTGILSRKREFAVLQAVGMTSKQLRAMLIYEGLFYALSSAAAALLLSFVLNPLVGNLLEHMFWFFSARFTIVPVLLAMPMFALLGWLIPDVMYNHTAGCSIVEQLRDDQ